ncbi:TonB-dependent receptor domain-containing protein [Paraglaciecola sp.]|uniref:TonB-dependent receptor domain-containing protein n=1 Tax=Paraglaciecola sp. TaxID=1920173 RepID=UPI003EF7D928
MFAFNAQAKEINQEYDFNIPVQSLSQALNELSDVAKISFLFPYELVENKTGSLVQGKYTVQQALSLLLKNSGLEGELSDKKAFVIKPLSPKSQNNENLGKEPMNTQKTLLASIFTMLFSSAGNAQDADTNTAENNAAQLEVITVNARRRTENLQEVPDTVVSMGEALISRANITTAVDVTTRMPNVSMVESLSPTSTYIMVRGIASVRNSEPAVAMIIDGVQVGSATEMSQSFFDVEQIELLKGPQGALYGRNAIGGALIVTSKKPGDTLEGKITTGIGNGGLFEVSGSLAGPITDDLYFRVAGNNRSFDGLIHNEYLEGLLEKSNAGVVGKVQTDSLMDFQKNNDFRAQLFWEASNKTTVNYRFAKNDLTAGAMFYRNIFRLESDENATYEAPISSESNPVAVRTIDTNTLKIDHEFDSGTLTSVSNYTDTNERYGVAGENIGSNRTANVWFQSAAQATEMVDSFAPGGANANPIDYAFFESSVGGNSRAGVFAGSDQQYDVQTFSQDLRFVSEDDGGKFSYVAGAYLLLTERADSIRATWEVPSVGSDIGESFTCDPKYPGGPIISDFSSCSGVILSTQNTQDNSAWAMYFSSDYKITDELTLTTALRYDEDSREVTRIDGPTVDTMGKGVGAFGADCDSVADPDNCAVTGSKVSDTFSAWQPKASLAYVPNKNYTYYATYARGFRSGGFNASGALLTDTYKSEILDSYELGIKASLMDNRMRASVATFYQDYENVQQFEFDGNVFIQSLYNIPESTINGIEGSIEFAATENLTINAAFGLMDSSIDQYDPAIRDNIEEQLGGRIANGKAIPDHTQDDFDNNFKGAKLPNFAHQTANIGMQHNLPLGDNYLITRIDYNFSSDQQWWLDGEDHQDNVGLFDASIGYEFENGLEVRAWCKNCTDVEYDSEYSPAERELFGGAAKDLAYPGRGRTAGIKVEYSF